MGAKEWAKGAASDFGSAFKENFANVRPGFAKAGAAFGQWIINKAKNPLHTLNDLFNIKGVAGSYYGKAKQVFGNAWRSAKRGAKRAYTRARYGKDSEEYKNLEKEQNEEEKQDGMRAIEANKDLLGEHVIKKLREVAMSDLSESEKALINGTGGPAAEKAFRDLQEYMKGKKTFSEVNKTNLANGASELIQGLTGGSDNPQVSNMIRMTTQALGVTNPLALAAITGADLLINNARVREMAKSAGNKLVQFGKWVLRGFQKGEQPEDTIRVNSPPKASTYGAPKVVQVESETPTASTASQPNVEETEDFTNLNKEIADRMKQLKDDKEFYIDENGRIRKRKKRPMNEGSPYASQDGVNMVLNPRQQPKMWKDEKVKDSDTKVIFGKVKPAAKYNPATERPYFGPGT